MDVFSLRRAVERLRDGLFDPVAVKLLTMEEEQVKKNFSKGLKALEKGKSEHLCICGSYGQGKSHTLTYLNQYALSLGYATSLVQLDLREIPFHQFSAVHNSLMEKLTLPDGESFASAWIKWGDKNSLEFLNTMPHRFRMILTAMLSKKKQPQKKEMTKKDKNCRPKEFPLLLEKALMGHDVPVTYLKYIFKSRDVEGYQKESLICRGNLPYVETVKALGTVLKKMGYKGLVLFFDEAESITQGRSGSRSKSYDVLDLFFRSKDFVYPVFAFTEEFFDKVNNEQYDGEKPIFSKNYAKDWKDLNIARLQHTTSDGWDILQNRLIKLYSEAYRIDLFDRIIGIKEKLQGLLDKLQAQEMRFKLKALVNRLDIETQQCFSDV